MSRHTTNRQPPSLKLAVTIGALIAIGLVVAVSIIEQPFFTSPAIVPGKIGQAAAVITQTPDTPFGIRPTQTPTFTPWPSATPTPTVTPTPSNTPTPTLTPTPTPTPTPTLNLAECNVSGCGSEAVPLPTVEFNSKLLLTYETPERRVCPECPKNEHLSEDELDALVGANDDTLVQLRKIALSQEPYPLAPGIVYIVSDYVHHVVVDLEEPGFKLRNIVPPIPDPETRENIRITPSYCFRPQSLLVMTADYHGLVGSNKTEEGREIFFHLGRAALFQRDGEYDLDVIREHSEFARTSISWGGGPIFIWDGEYDFNPEEEWFTLESLDHYRETTWAKLTVAVSEDRKYLFISASFGLELKEHADNIIDLGEKWGIQVDRAMRFDGSESAYLAIRMGDYMVPVLGLKEPLIVNCLAIERD